MRIARVFPHRTAATPVDPLAYVGHPPLPGLCPEVDEVHVSVTFTRDLAEAERLASAWARVAPVRIGGPATGERGDAFTPGMYLRPGYVITSRGCPNRCWFCDAWKREGRPRELPVTRGWNVLDDNLLACSEAHIRNVFAMLRCQHQRVEFTGGLEAARLRPWHVELLADLHPYQMFFAYDEPRDYEPLVEAGRLLRAGGFITRHGGIRHSLRCYVLCGWAAGEGRAADTLAAAHARMEATIRAGFMPSAMVWRDSTTGRALPGWSDFQRRWHRPAFMSAKLHEVRFDSGLRD